MVVTAAEFKANFGKYLELITNEDIFITRNGKTVAKVVNPQVTAVDSLRGMLDGNSSGVDMDSLREERLLNMKIMCDTSCATRNERDFEGFGRRFIMVCPALYLFGNIHTHIINTCSFSITSIVRLF